LLGYITEITTPVCKIDATSLVTVVFHDPIFTTRTSWGLLYMDEIVTFVCK